MGHPILTTNCREELNPTAQPDRTSTEPGSPVAWPDEPSAEKKPSSGMAGWARSQRRSRRSREGSIREMRGFGLCWGLSGKALRLFCWRGGEHCKSKNVGTPKTSSAFCWRMATSRVKMVFQNHTICHLRTGKAKPPRPPSFYQGEQEIKREASAFRGCLKGTEPLGGGLSLAKKGSPVLP